MPLSREGNERLDRLAGSGRGSGGGLPLPALFSAMLNELLDNESVSNERMTEIAASALSFKTEQVKAAWPTWEALTADVLAQMESRELIQRVNGSWMKGSRLVTGQRLEVIPARPRKGSKSDGVTVWTKEEREAKSRAAHRAGEATEMASTLRPENRGLRPVDQEHVQEIRDSLPEVGQIYPILVDQDGRILDGKHRYAANPEWKRHTVKVDSDEMALAIALWANKGAPLPSKVTARIESLVLGAKAARERQRERIKAALLEQATQERPLSHNAIAKRLGLGPAGHVTVGRLCEELIVQCTYSDCPHRFTEDGKEAPGPKPKADAPKREQIRELLEENPQQSNAQIRDHVGLNPNRHRLIEEERRDLEVEGRIPRVTAREGRDGTVRHNPGTTPPVPTPAARRNANDGSPWAVTRKRLADRLGRLLSRWENDSDDGTSELEELEALRREIDERITALRG